MLFFIFRSFYGRSLFGCSCSLFALQIDGQHKLIAYFLHVAALFLSFFLHWLIDYPLFSNHAVISSIIYTKNYTSNIDKQYPDLKNSSSWINHTACFIKLGPSDDLRYFWIWNHTIWIFCRMILKPHTNKTCDKSKKLSVCSFR